MGYKSKNQYDDDVTKGILSNYNDIIQLLGEDVRREGLLKTPERAAKAMQFLTQGYDQDPEAILKSALFKEDYNEMVVVKDIELYSLCEHHMLPFFGKAHVAYIPNGKIVGLSKIPRVIDAYYRRLQVQERLKIGERVRKKKEKKLWECVDRLFDNELPATWILMSNGITRMVSLLDLQQDYVKVVDTPPIRTPQEEDDGA